MWTPFRKKQRKKIQEQKTDPSGSLYKRIIEQLTTLSDTQASDRIVLKCVEILKEPRSEAEYYDFLDSISKEPCIKIADKVCLGEISSFVQSLCNVTKYYPRPDDASNIGSTNGESISDTLPE